MDDLATRVQDLPAELYNNILDLVFAVEQDASVRITTDYKPPVQLQVSHSTRERFASEYYGTTTFVMPEENYFIFVGWLVKLPDHHSLAIRKIHVTREIRWHYSDYAVVVYLRSKREVLKSALTFEDTQERDFEEVLSLDTVISAEVTVFRTDGKIKTVKGKSCTFGEEE